MAKCGKLEFDLNSLRNSESRQLSQLRAEYDGQLAMLKQEVERLARERKSFEDRYVRLETEYNNERTKVVQYSQELERVGKEYNLLNSRLGDIDQLSRVNADLQGRLNRLMAEKKALEDEYGNLQREYSTAGQRLSNETN